ncbi:MAG: 4-hydroxy-tetrahydrodipicolinate synthase [Elusimicrobiaceae bacterium]|nr:4-hydroxy-tetrahydrodipicolinate synthase [Elusimicrobiaceae bacterium]
MFKGVLTALITPFKDNKIDFRALEVLIEKQLAAGVSGFVVLGTTAETPALNEQEKQDLIKFCTEKINKRAKIIIGTGSNNTQAMLKNCEAASKYNPDALLIVTPYYNKPNLSGMIAHYTLASQFNTPIVLYHIPGRTGQKLSLKFFEELLNNVPQIQAVKESCYDISHLTEMSVKFSSRIEYLCGNDDLWPVFLGLGSRAIISAAANTMAPLFVKVYTLFTGGKTQEAMALFSQGYSLIKASYTEVNPTCIKYLLSLMNLASDEVRLPLGTISDESKKMLSQLYLQTSKEILL